MAKNMFYNDGMPSNNFDGRCTYCPFMLKDSMGEQCSESEKDVSNHVRTGNINYDCPFRTKDE